MSNVLLQEYDKVSSNNKFELFNVANDDMFKSQLKFAESISKNETFLNKYNGKTISNPEEIETEYSVINSFKTDAVLFYFITTTDNEILGYIELYVYNSITRYVDNPDTMNLDNLFIFEKYRNKGYGNEVIEAIKSLARDMNIKLLLLEVIENNSAVNLYENQGFKKYKQSMFLEI